MHDLVAPEDAIEEVASIDIAASPEQVAAVYRNVDNWGSTFPDTIQSAHVVKEGDNWKQIEVEHRYEGRVANTLIDLSPTEIALQESKKKFEATFLNRFEPTAEGETHYVIHAYVSLKGIYKLLKPLLKGYVQRQTLEQVRSFVLIPIKTAAEKRVDSQRKGK
jgi:hypothetical protein